MKNENTIPLVSIVMATFNEPKEIIKQAITSMLNQTLSDFELLIIDDSTSPETINEINNLAQDPRIVLIRQTTRIGFVKALNIGLKNAKGKYIARMDGDDISMITRLEQQVNFLKNNNEYSVVGGGINIINADGVVTAKRFYPSKSFRLNLWSIFRSPFAHPTVMMRREIIDKGFLYNESFSKSEDLEFWMRLKKNNFRFYNLSGILLNYRIGEDFGKKRSGSQLKSNHKARYINFSWKYPISGFLSLFVTKIYMITPLFLVEKFYSRENTSK